MEKFSALPGEFSGLGITGAPPKLVGPNLKILRFRNSVAGADGRTDMWTVIQQMEPRKSRGLGLIFDKGAALMFAGQFSALWKTQTSVYEMIDGVPQAEPVAVFAGGTLVKGTAP